jgi:hypothetical protein
MIGKAGTAKRYWTRLPNGDAMIGLVDDETGLLVIWEYDGCWGHRWNPDHLGPGPSTGLLSGLVALTPQQAIDAATAPPRKAQSLTSFVLQADARYLADKLVPDDKKYAIDDEATATAHREAAKELGLHEDDEVYQEIERKDWEDVVAGRSDSPLADHIDDHYTLNDLIVYEDSRWMKVVRDQCIPALKAAIREQTGAAHGRE